MPFDDERIRDAVRRTQVLRPPRQTLATFGTTNVSYYLLTTPVYSELVNEEETVIREGKVSSEKPRIVTPSYLTRIEGFGENARRYLDMAISQYGPHAPGLLYSYRNEASGLSIVSDGLDVVAQRLGEKIEREGDRLSAIISGIDELWDVSLIKFISELTEGSLRRNLAELGSRGLLDVDEAGVPMDARYRIESLFQQVMRGEREPSELKEELERWDLFPQYEDRFLKLFRRG